MSPPIESPTPITPFAVTEPPPGLNGGELLAPIPPARNLAATELTPPDQMLPAFELPPGANAQPVPKQVEQTANEIKKDITESQGNFDDRLRNEIYQSLDELRNSTADFKRDLSLVNEQLQKDGFFPDLIIVSNETSPTAQPETQIGPAGTKGFHLEPEASQAAINFSPEQPSADIQSPGLVAGGDGMADAGAADGESGTAGGGGGSEAGESSGESGESGGGSSSTESYAPQSEGGDDPQVQQSKTPTEPLSDPELESQIVKALDLLNAQRAAQGLPPIEANEENIRAILTIIQHESSGDPNAENEQGGNNPCGLMQTKVDTFKENCVEGAGTNIFDPVANIAAGVNYAVNRYGSLQDVPGVASINAGGEYQPY